MPDEAPSQGARVRSLFAEFTARSGCEALVDTLLRNYAATVRGQVGTLTFSAHRRADQPSLYFVFERYRSEIAFQEHVDSAESADFNRRLRPLIVEPSSVLTMLDEV